MQDRFKFRFWNGTVMCTFDIFTNYYEMSYVKSRKLPIMQCTGLKDKNGRLIYEGDIARFYYWYPKIVIARISWIKDSSFRIRTKKTGAGIIFNPKLLATMEVIGNIYENPELLTEDKE